MGVEEFFFRNPNFPLDVIGNAMESFFGGRSEVRIRKTPVDVVVIDSLSIYPTGVI